MFLCFLNCWIIDAHFDSENHTLAEMPADYVNSEFAQLERSFRAGQLTLEDVQAASVELFTRRYAEYATGDECRRFINERLIPEWNNTVGRHL